MRFRLKVGLGLGLSDLALPVLGGVEQLLGLSTSTVRGFVGAGRRPPLLRGEFLAFAVVPPGVLLGQPAALLVHLGGTTQRPGQVLNPLPGVRSGAVETTPAFGVLALGRGQRSEVSRVLTGLPLSEAPEDRLLAFIRGSLALVRGSLALVRGSLALVRRSLALVRGSLALVRGSLALVRRSLALIRGSLALIRDSLGRRWLSAIASTLALAAQRTALTLEGRLLRVELRRVTLDLRAKPLGLEPGRVIAVLQRTCQQLLQTRPVRLKLG